MDFGYYSKLITRVSEEMCIVMVLFRMYFIKSGTENVKLSIF